MRPTSERERERRTSKATSWRCRRDGAHIRSRRTDTRHQHPSTLDRSSRAGRPTSQLGVALGRCERLQINVHGGFWWIIGWRDDRDVHVYDGECAEDGHTNHRSRRYNCSSVRSFPTHFLFASQPFKRSPDSRHYLLLRRAEYVIYLKVIVSFCVFCPH